MENLLQKVEIPEGESGDWKITRFTISEKGAERFNLSAAFSFSNRGRHVTPGTYTRLTRNGHIVMSDTPNEMDDHHGFVIRARGNVLIAGLGLGMVAAAVARNPDVLSVTVVEISEDVHELVAPSFVDNPKVYIILDNIMTWKPHARMAHLEINKFDYAWYDIWDDLCADNLEGMKFLHRRFGRWVKNQDSWGRSLLERYR